MGRRGADYSRRQGAAHGAQPEGRRSQRRPGAGARRRSAGQRDPRPAPELRGQAAPRDPDRDPVCRGDRAPGRRGHRQAFPGPGRGARGAPTSRSSGSACARGELRRIDERPYRAFAARDGDMVMISTAIYTHFSHKPAAFTKRIATGELRARLGFEGVSISDALETESARQFGGPAKVGVAAARAGTDLLLFTGLPRRRSSGAGADPPPALGRAAAPTVRGLRPARAGPALPDRAPDSHRAARRGRRNVGHPCYRRTG